VLEDRPNRDIIERAEDFILRLREVQSARIYTDEQGTITEIHVVAETDRAPKLLARDVETCLKASLGLTVDYRKIGVVVIDPSKGILPRRGDPLELEHELEGEDWTGRSLDEVLAEKLTEAPARPNPSGPSGSSMGSGQTVSPEARPSSARSTGPEPRDAFAPAAPSPGSAPAPRAAPEPAIARLEFLEEDARIKFKSLRVVIEEDKVDVEVSLEKCGLTVTGSQGDLRFRGRLYETIAGATIHAVAELLDENMHLCFSGIEEVVLGGRKAICTVVSVVEGRSVASFVGCAVIGDDRNESAALAVLDALNRPLGKWKLRGEINYTIR